MYLNSSICNLFPAPKLKSLLIAMLLYPCCILISWLPNIILFFISYINPTDDNPSLSNPIDAAILISTGWGVLYGGILAFAFLINSKETQKRWYYLTIGNLIGKSRGSISNFFSTDIIEDSDILEDFGTVSESNNTAIANISSVPSSVSFHSKGKSDSSDRLSSFSAMSLSNWGTLPMTLLRNTSISHSPSNAHSDDASSNGFIIEIPSFLHKKWNDVLRWKKGKRNRRVSLDCYNHFEIIYII